METSYRDRIFSLSVQSPELSWPNIAKQVGCNVSLVYYYLDATGKEQRAIAKEAFLAGLVDELKTGKSCKHCGYDKFIGALQFHHVNGDKESLVSYLCAKGNKYGAIREAKKCELLCGNCHASKHHKDCANWTEEYGLMAQCCVCGFAACKGAIDLHHIDEQTKIFNLSRYRDYNRQEICDELQKCCFLCKNC